MWTSLDTDSNRSLICNDYVQEHDITSHANSISKLFEVPMTLQQKKQLRVFR